MQLVITAKVPGSNASTRSPGTVAEHRTTFYELSQLTHIPRATEGLNVISTQAGVGHHGIDVEAAPLDPERLLEVVGAEVGVACFLEAPGQKVRGAEALGWAQTDQSRLKRPVQLVRLGN